MQLLIVRTSSMGDLIHTWPAVTDLAEHFPNVEISWLAEEGFADIARLHPAVRRVIPLAWRRWRRSLLSPATWREMRALKATLQGGRWDWVIDSQGLLKSALPARLAQGPLVGYDFGSIREPLASLLYDRRLTVPRTLNAIERNRRLFGQALGYNPEGAPRFGIGAGERPPWLTEGGYAVFLHATSRPSKEWPEQAWIALGKTLAETEGWPVVLPWGNDTEKARAERLAQAMPAAVVAPRLSLPEAAGLIGHAAAVVGVDTGLTHLANALDVPLVALYTDTDPARTGVVETAWATNLGGIGACPTPEAVLDALRRVRQA
ncbi:lipopolysaccharide heptosyltransferase I [Gulbenkiania indica]|uniref:Lipopolysaccharide heptosyltransferase 1 n=2 Tax=Gulbenkiania indica TaxID=375574 RepID=A0A0K6GWZ4_9NEIS|nr:lipopolysaccharide heptosyltransferase I [Gulbenkiania indica]